MIRAIQHVPAFVDGHTPEKAEADTIQELLQTPWIQRYAQSWPDHDVQHCVISWPNGKETEAIETRHVKGCAFYRWSISRRPGCRPNLMAESNDGFNWWVAAYLESDGPIDLPEWKPRYKAIIDGKEVVLDHGEVSWSCGDKLGLRDGCEVKDATRAPR